MPNRFVIASNNHNKTNELIKIFSWFGQTAISYQSLIKPVDFPPEGERDYFTNALNKAKWIAKKIPNEWIVADDTGMVLDAYPNDFGITTARDLHMDQLADSELNQKIIALVAGKQRGVCMNANLVAVNQACIVKSQGKFIGQISHEPRGNNGKSFDLILEDLELHATLAEMPDELKIPRLHRSQAVEKLLKQLNFE